MVRGSRSSPRTSRSRRRPARRSSRSSHRCGPRCRSCGRRPARPMASAGFDALVMAAAVADFRPVARAETKLSRAEAPDARARTDARPARGDRADRPRARPRRGAHRATARPTPVLVGFAAETGSLARAAEKLRRKHVDLLVANDVTEAGSGFGDGHQPGLDLRRRRRTRRPPAPHEAGRRRRAARSGGPPRWTSATPPGRLSARSSLNGSEHERHSRVQPAA